MQHYMYSLKKYTTLIFIHMRNIESCTRVNQTLVL